MRWFMHPADFSTHPIVSAIRAEFGNEGFGALCRIMEQVTAAWEIKDGEPVPMPRLSLPIKDWRNITDFSPQKFEKFLEICQHESFLCSEYDGKVIHITMPIMFEYMDNYSRKICSKSGVSTESLPTASRLQQQENPDVYKRQNNTQNCSPQMERDIRKILLQNGIEPDSKLGEFCRDHVLAKAKNNPAGYLRTIFASNPNFGREEVGLFLPTEKLNEPTAIADLLPRQLLLNSGSKK